ncbi:MAG: ribosome-associated translation inhibitor RaiA [Opitutaceae bacterium]
MNDFPIPEDPPVTMTVENEESALLTDGMKLSGINFRPTGVPAGLCSTQTYPRNMNSPNNHELIVSGIHLELTPSLKIFVREKADRLFRHEERIVRIRVELECDSTQEVGARFHAKGHIALLGPGMNASVQADECHKAVALLVDKLDRMLEKRHQIHKMKRNHPHAVEFNGVDLPKAL